MGRLKILLNNISTLETELQSLYKQLEQEKDDMFNAIVETAPTFIAIIQDEKFVFVNSTGLVLLNCKTSNDIIGKNIFEILHPDVHIIIKDRLLNLEKNITNIPLHIKFLKTNGQYIDVEASSIPFVYNNALAGLIAGRDITDELIHKQKLEDEKNLRELVLNSFPELIAFYEPNHKIRWMNDAAKKLYGITDDSYVGKNCYSVRFNTDKPCTDCPMLSNRAETHERIVHDKNTIWNVRHTPIVNLQGVITGYIELSVDITNKEKRKAEFRNAESKLRESEQRFREIFENSNDSIFLLEVTDDMRFRNLDCNEAFEKSTGIKRDKLIGKYTTETGVEESSKKTDAFYRRCVETKEAFIDKEIELKLPSGTRYYLSSIIPISDQNGKIYRILGITRDITERKQLEILLSKKQANLEEAQRIGKIGSWELNLQNNQIERSAEIFKIYEIEPSLKDFSPETFLSLIHSEDREKVQNAHTDSVKNKQSYTIEYRLLFADERIKYVLESCETYYDTQDKPLRSLGTVQDITVRKQMEETLKASEQEYRSLAENSPDNIIRYNLECRATYGNHLVKTTMEDAQSVFLGKTPLECYPNGMYEGGLEEVVNYQAAMEQVLLTGETKEMEMHVPTPTGALHTFLAVFTPERDTQGNIMGVLAFGRDITERKQMEEALAKREQEFRTLVENSPDVIVRYDKDCNRLYFNPAFQELADFQSSELAGTSPAQLSPLSTDQASVYLNTIKKVFETSLSQSMEIRWPLSDDDLWYNMRAVPEFDKEGNVTSVLAIARDVTELKKTKQQIEMLGFALNKASDAIFLLEENSIRFAYVNDNACRSLRYSREELMQLSLTDIDPDIDAEALRQMGLKTSFDKSQIFETRHKTKDGFIFPVEVTNTLYRYGDKIYRLSIVRDITERKQAENALQEERKLFIGGPNVAFKWRAADGWPVEYVSPNIFEQFGYASEDLTSGKVSFASIVHPDDLPRIATEVAYYSEIMLPYFEQEYRLAHSSGEYLWVYDFTVPVRNFNNEITHYKGYLTNITERKQAEQALSESEQRYRLVFENSPVSIWEEDFSEIKKLFDELRSKGVPDLELYFAQYPEAVLKFAELVRITDINQSALSLQEASSKKELLANLSNTFTTESFETFKKELVHIWNGGTELVIDAVVITFTGRIRNVTVYFSICPGFENTLSKVLVSLIDITDRKLAEEAIVQLNADLNATLQAIPDMLFEIDSNGVYLNVWAKESNHLLLNKEKLVGYSMFDILPNNVVEIVKYTMDEVREKGYSMGKIYYLDFPTGRRWFELSVTNKIVLKTSEEHFILLVREITDRKLAEEALRESQQRLSKAELVASIGHIEYDFVNGMSYWSDGTFEILNTPEESRNTEKAVFLEMVIHNDDSERVRSALERAVKEHIKFDEIYRIIDFKGNEKVIHGYGQVQVNIDGTTGSYFGIIQDITLMYTLNAQLLAEEEKFRLLAECSPLGIYISVGKTPVYANKPMMNMAGVDSLGSLASAKLFDLIHPEDRLKVNLLTERLKQEDSITSPYKLSLRKLSDYNTIRHYDVYVTTFSLHNVKHLQFVIVDKTEDYENEQIRQQLAASSLYIDQKNKLAGDIESTLKIILSSSKKFEKADFQPVVDILRSYSHADKDWELLKSHIENIHPEFVSTLKKHCATLSVNDIKHCACIRLNLDTKEIARFFNVKPSSIQTSRVRLKKKFQLPESTDLRDFIQSI